MPYKSYPFLDRRLQIFGVDSDYIPFLGLISAGSLIVSALIGSITDITVGMTSLIFLEIGDYVFIYRLQRKYSYRSLRKKILSYRLPMGLFMGSFCFSDLGFNIFSRVSLKDSPILDMDCRAHVLGKNYRPSSESPPSSSEDSFCYESPYSENRFFQGVPLYDKEFTEMEKFIPDRPISIEDRANISKSGRLIFTFGMPPRKMTHYEVDRLQEFLTDGRLDPKKTMTKYPSNHKRRHAPQPSAYLTHPFDPVETSPPPFLREQILGCPSVLSVFDKNFEDVERERFTLFKGPEITKPIILAGTAPMAHEIVNVLHIRKIKQMGHRHMPQKDTIPLLEMYPPPTEKDIESTPGWIPSTVNTPIDKIMTECNLKDNPVLFENFPNVSLEIVTPPFMKLPDPKDTVFSRQSWIDVLRSYSNIGRYLQKAAFQKQILLLSHGSNPTALPTSLLSNLNPISLPPISNSTFPYPAYPYQ